MSIRFPFIIYCLFFLTSSSAYAGNNCRALVVVGMADEYKAAIGENSQYIEVVVGTANAERLQQRLDALDPSMFSAVFSFGVAGGLDPTLPSGTLLFSKRVITQKNKQAFDYIELPVDKKMLRKALLLTNNTSLPSQPGIFFGSDTEARDQHVDWVTGLYDQAGAQLIDNETHLAARFAVKNHLPFLSIRAISDSVHKPLPPAALLPLDPEDGSPDGWAITKSLLTNPFQIPALVRTASEYGKAIDSLKAFRKNIGFEQMMAASNGHCVLSNN